MKLHIKEHALNMCQPCACNVMWSVPPQPHTTQQPYKIGLITLTDIDHNTKA